RPRHALRSHLSQHADDVISKWITKDGAKDVPRGGLAVAPERIGSLQVWHVHGVGLVEQSIEAGQPQHLCLRPCRDRSSQAWLLHSQHRIDRLPPSLRRLRAPHLRDCASVKDGRGEGLSERFQRLLRIHTATWEQLRSAYTHPQKAIAEAIRGFGLRQQ